MMLCIKFIKYLEKDKYKNTEKTSNLEDSIKKLLELKIFYKAQIVNDTRRLVKEQQIMTFQEMELLYQKSLEYFHSLPEITSKRKRSCHRAVSLRDAVLLGLLTRNPCREYDISHFIFKKHILYDKDSKLVFNFQMTKNHLKSERWYALDYPSDGKRDYYLKIYLKKYRSVLAKKSKVKFPYIFLSANGKPLFNKKGVGFIEDDVACPALHFLITKLTKKYIGKACGPHIFRDSVAVHLCDYLFSKKYSFENCVAIAAYILGDEPSTLRSTYIKYRRLQKRAGQVYKDVIGDMLYNNNSSDNIPIFLQKSENSDKEANLIIVNWAQEMKAKQTRV